MSNAKNLGIAKLNQLETLQVLDGLPPSEYIRLCWSNDQLYYWFVLKEYYSLLKISFKNYFTGKADTHLDKLSINQKNHFELMTDYYLDFYKMIQVGWCEILKCAENEGYDFNIVPATNPGETLIRVLENDCFILFKPCLEHHYRHTPSKTRELYRTEKQILKLMDDTNHIPDELSQKDKNKIKAYQYKLKEVTKLFEKERALKDFCINICRQSKSERVQKFYKRYDDSRKDLDKFIQSCIHERHKVKGGQWDDGIYTSMSKFGGVPISS
jgi:hypothetical protein